MQNHLETYLTRIRNHIPTLEVASAHLNSDGMMNDVVVVNHDGVFRFAKTEAAKTLMIYEIHLLRVIGQHVALPIPHIEYATDDFMHYRFVAGAPLYRHTLLRMDENTQDTLASELATFLQQLHAIPLSDIPSTPWQAASPQQTWTQRLDALKEKVFPLLWKDQKDWINDLFAPISDGQVNLDAYAPALIHDDLASYHILHNADTGHLTGVIDFGTAHAGDAAKDWACLISVYGESFVQRIHRHYPVAQATIDRARFYANALELEWALNGIQSDDKSLLLVHLGRARDSAPLLSRWV